MGPHEVDLLASSYLRNAMHRQVSERRKTSFNCAVDADRNALENAVRHQTSTIYSKTLTISRRFGADLTWCFRALDEHSPAHPKTIGFFQDSSVAIMVLDANALHEIHPIGRVTNAVWAMQCISTLNSGATRNRWIYCVMVGVTEFMAGMAERSPAELLAHVFDDFIPSAEDTTRAERRPGTVVLHYVLERLSSGVRAGWSLAFALLDDERRSYYLLKDNIIELIYPTPIRWCTLY